jgi:hypothetical protein
MACRIGVQKMAFQSSVDNGHERYPNLFLSKYENCTGEGDFGPWRAVFERKEAFCVQKLHREPRRVQFSHGRAPKPEEKESKRILIPLPEKKLPGLAPPTQGRKVTRDFSSTKG